MLRNSNKNGWKNLYLHPESFYITFKSNSYLLWISCHGPVTLLNHSFPSINLQKQWQIYVMFGEIVEEGLQWSLFPLFHLEYELQILLFSNTTVSLWPCKFVNPNFRQYQSDRNSGRFNCWFQVQLDSNSHKGNIVNLIQRTFHESILRKCTTI